nr:hypothetical protein [Tanacetum cinerariifolium]
MLNKENYVPWSSRLLRYAKSRPNGKLIRNSIINGPYVRRMIPEPGDTNREVPVNETFHVQTDDELTEKDLKQIEADDQAIQTILLGFDIGIQEKKSKLFNEWESQKEVDELKAKRLAKTQDPLALMANSNNPYAFQAPHQDQPSFNQNYMQQPIPNHEDIIDPTTAMNMALAQMAKAFKLNYSTPTNNNQRISSNPRNRQIAQLGMNMGQDRQMQMVGGNAENQFRQFARQNNPRVQNVGNQNGLIGVPGNDYQNGNGNLVVARAEGNAIGQNGNQIRCYNCKGVGYFARNCTVRPRRRDAAYLQTQLLIAQKEEAGIQLQVEEFDLMAATADLDEIEEVNANYRPAEYTELHEPIPEPHEVTQNDNNIISEDFSVEQSGGTVEQYPANIEETRALYDSLYQSLAIQVEKVNTANKYDLIAAAADLDEIEEVNVNCILMANLQQASTLGTQTDNAPVYDTDGSTKVHENYDDNEIFNMFTQEEQYTELLKPIPESHQVPQNDNDVISEDTNVEQGGETAEQHPANFEETRALYESLYQNLAIKVEKVNSVNRKLKETNADLTTELARFKNQERSFEISQEKYDKLERCYQQSVYQEQCLSKKINALHLSFGKQIMTFNEQIFELNKQLSKEKSTVSFLLEEKKKLKSDFKTCEDKLLDKQILLKKRIKELNNIVLSIDSNDSYALTEAKLVLSH